MAIQLPILHQMKIRIEVLASREKIAAQL